MGRREAGREGWRRRQKRVRRIGEEQEVNLQRS